MRLLFAGSCPKDFEEPAPNEDQFGLSDDGERCVVCDGASESYNSRLWAQILCRRFLEDRAVGPAWIEAARAEYLVASDLGSMSWSQSAAFERGSFSTLLGVERDSESGAIRALAIGDSAALLIDEGKLVEAWPFADPERFKEHPTLLSTLEAQNSFAGEEGFSERSWKCFRLDGLRDPLLLCMTDAVAEWSLRSLDEGERLAELAALRDEQSLRDLVSRERQTKRMRVDDSTLIVLSLRSEGDAVPNL